MNANGKNKATDSHQDKKSFLLGALAAFRDLGFLALSVMWHANGNEHDQAQEKRQLSNPWAHRSILSSIVLITTVMNLP
jgi:hypothetical protein